MPVRCLVQEVASAGSSLAVLVNPDIDIARRMQLNSTAAHCAPEPSFGRVTSLCLHFGTRWRWVASVISRPFYRRAKNTWHTVDRILGGSRYCSGCKRETSFPARKWTPIIWSSRGKYRTDRVTWPLDIHKQTNVVIRQTMFLFIVEGFIDSSHLACSTMCSTELLGVEIALWTCVWEQRASKFRWLSVIPTSFSYLSLGFTHKWRVVKSNWFLKGVCTRKKYKVKDTLVHAMKWFVGVEVQRHSLITFALNAVCINFTPSPLYHLYSLHRKLREVHSQCGPPEKFWDCTSNYENTGSFTII